MEETVQKNEQKQLKGRPDFKLKLAAKPQTCVPQLDLKQIKNLNEFKDWQSYAIKLEQSIKFLRERVDTLD